MAAATSGGGDARHALPKEEEELKNEWNQVELIWFNYSKCLPLTWRDVSSRDGEWLTRETRDKNSRKFGVEQFREMM